MERQAAGETRSSRRRGRPPIGRSTPLELEEILLVAHRIVREHGLAAFTMRGLADQLGVTPMAIYHHVPDKPTLVYLLVEGVWQEVASELQAISGRGGIDDLLEFCVQICLTMRRVWLDNLELANVAMTVTPVSDDLLSTTGVAAAMFEAAGFPNVPLAYGALQTYTMGSIATLANRRSSSAYFGHDPAVVLAEATRRLEASGASADHRGVMVARFDEGDDRNFEPGLRCLIAGLLQSSSVREAPS